MISPRLLLTHRLRLVLALGLCVSAIGCLDSVRWGGDEDCAPSSRITFEGLEETGEDRPGAMQAANLHSVCNRWTCDAVFPLVVGSDHGFYVLLEQATAEETPDPEALSLASSDPDVLAVEPGAAESDEITIHGIDGCERERRVWVQGTMRPRNPGSARIELRRHDELVDSFEIVIDRPSALRIEPATQEHAPPVHEGAITVERDDLLLLEARALQADGVTNMIMSQRAAQWSVADPQVLELTPLEVEGTASAEVAATAVSATLHQSGSTLVTLSVGDLTTALEIEVASQP